MEHASNNDVKEEKEVLKDSTEEKEVADLKKAASFFELQYTLLKRFDYLVITFAMVGSIGTGIAMPLFSIIFGGSINAFGGGDGSVNPDQFIEDIRSLCLKFLYVGLGMWLAGFIMIWLWNFNGRTIAKRIKKNYFKLLMKQEQAYFDQKDTFQFATKIQTQVKSIEMGVRKYKIKLNNLVGRQNWKFNYECDNGYFLFHSGLHLLLETLTRSYFNSSSSPDRRLFNGLST